MVVNLQAHHPGYRDISISRSNIELLPDGGSDRDQITTQDLPVGPILADLGRDRDSLPFSFIKLLNSGWLSCVPCLHDAVRPGARHENNFARTVHGKWLICMPEPNPVEAIKPQIRDLLAQHDCLFQEFLSYCHIVASSGIVILKGIDTGGDRSPMM
ncbi:hypothetical protein N7456_005587 [Penicillium angulare]|uniref:Uncharacterized protein n=1 Tax=Penicillium angulare TaxID=116970 RepID=A0A9W9FYT5_9EURO|nr:hypothetical protein N7456_005587 [Penicillium angulare]